MTQNLKTIGLKHIKDWVEGYDEAGEVILLPKYETTKVVCSYTRRYHNNLRLLSGLSGCARDLLDFITEEMDEQNVICTNTHFRSRFSTFIWNNTFTEANKGIHYGDGAIKKALGLLTGRGLLIRERRGYSLVNPLYFWRNEDGRRLWLIRQQMERANGSEAKLKTLRVQFGEVKIADGNSE